MASNNMKVLLGFEDELITEKHKNQTNFTTNKIGGRPDLPSNVQIDIQVCPLCQLPRPLVLQIYVPLENSPYHRTLYIFACVNPNCWNQNDSWVCLRVQSEEQIIPSPDITKELVKTTPTDWCVDADDWDDDNNTNSNEENGNLINSVERVSDEDEESCSLDESIKARLENITIDERNANREPIGGAVGRMRSPSASAEIEVDESEVVSIDSPIMPRHDISALLHEVTPLPHDLYQNVSNERKISALEFTSSFIAVAEEYENQSNISDEHVKGLLQEYQQSHCEDLSAGVCDGATADNSVDNSYEKYEKSSPAHGDKMFHYFLSKIQMNPGQILRYSRQAEGPLLLHALQEAPKKCSYCQSDVVFEMQILPTIIPKLKLITDAKANSRLEFGTILVFSCSKSCWSTDSQFKYETVVLQSEVC